MIGPEEWPEARLIPISSASGVEAQERRAASALLAVIAAVPEFGRAVLKPLGSPSGRIETFIEVPFKIDDRTIRPDGIIVVTRGAKTWVALVETKVGNMTLDPNQIDAYLDLARHQGFQAVLSISNQYVTSSSEYPVEVDRRKLKKVALSHWSWINVLTEAVVQKDHRGISDTDQAYILKELIWYLSDPRSGAVAFDSMGPHWKQVREGARAGTLRRDDRGVAAVSARWDDLIRYLGLELTKDLGRDVKHVLTKKERTPTARLAALCTSLATEGRLYAELKIPNVAGPLKVVADLRARQISVSTSIDAPREGRSKGRVSWLLRRMSQAPDDVKVEAKIARSSQSLATTLGTAKVDPTPLYPAASKEIRQFEVSLSRNMGIKVRSGRGSFIESLINTTEEFYSGVLQNLRPWKAPPPKLRKPKQDPEAMSTEPTSAEPAASPPQELHVDDGDDKGSTSSGT